MAKSTGYSSSEVKAGLFLTFCLALFVAMLFVYGKAARMWRGRQELTVVFTSVTSLRPDAPVRFNGVEVGRVKSIDPLNLDTDNLTQMSPFTYRDLDDLPLREEEKSKLRKLPMPGPQAKPEEAKSLEEAFDKAVREHLSDRTMIRLVLEVLNPKGKDEVVRRYRVDDQVRISTTLLGDTSVEISSGNRNEYLDPSKAYVILGHSGDFFSNLGKSIEQVKEILANVNDVVGTQERESVRQALRRFDTITDKIESIVKEANKRMPITWDKVDLLADSARKDLDAIGETVTGLQPQISKTLTSADEAVKDLQKKLGDLADEARQAVVDVKGQVKPILEDVQYISSHSKDDFPLLVKNSKDLAARLKQSADKLDVVLSTGDRLLQESYPDLRRLILSLRMGAENFQEATDKIKRKPWLVINKPERDSEFDKAQDTARRLEIATKRFMELTTELQAVRRGLPASPNKAQLEKLDFLIQELNVLAEVLKDSGDLAKKVVLPDFVRKKGAFVAAPEMEALNPPK